MEVLPYSKKVFKNRLKSFPHITINLNSEKLKFDEPQNCAI